MTAEERTFIQIDWLYEFYLSFSVVSTILTCLTSKYDKISLNIYYYYLTSCDLNELSTCSFDQKLYSLWSVPDMQLLKSLMLDNKNE